jgi:hypothetical protein
LACRLYIHLICEASVVLAVFSLDGASFALSFDLAVQFDSHIADFGEFQILSIQFVSSLRIGEAVIWVLTLKSRGARFFPAVETTEKRLKSFVQPLGYVLKNLIMDFYTKNVGCERAETLPYPTLAIIPTLIPARS